MKQSINIQDKSPVLTKPEFCSIYKISIAMLNRLIRKGKGPKVIKFERKALISKEEADRWFQNLIKQIKE